MIGAIVGDIVGSRFEWHNIKTKKFDFFTQDCFFTDDSIMSLAVCDALMKCQGDYSNLGAQTVKSMQEIGRPYPDSGYGGSFYRWIYTDNPKPYNSFGNGSAMRVSGCGYAAKSLEEAQTLALKVTEISHNHPEGIKGAVAVSCAVYLARTGAKMAEIKEYIEANFYKLDFTLDGIRDSYSFNETCQGSVPQGLAAFFESTSFEDAIRNAISIGGDSDTIAAIAGAPAGAYYKIPDNIRNQALSFLDGRLKPILLNFEKTFCP
ncbi:MAG: ADP-ribosylglycohydrolase family protein [bacterium]|nr:ADP-ribosylglycohydrolase family protein [bacterium]